MACNQYKELLMGYLDNELNDHQRRQVEEHLAQCRNCAAELEQFRKLKAITDDLALVQPEDRIWQDYWSGVYNRIERRLGWILFSIAGVLLTVYGGFELIEQIVKDPAVGIILKIALLMLIVGIAILFVSVLRERLYFWKADRYKDVRR